MYYFTSSSKIHFETYSKSKLVDVYFDLYLMKSIVTMSNKCFEFLGLVMIT